MPAEDQYRGAGPTLTSSIVGSFAIVPSDSEELPHVTRQLRVTGAAGNMAVVWPDGNEAIEPVSAGDVLDWRVRQVKATGTTATGLRGYF